MSISPPVWSPNFQQYQKPNGPVYIVDSANKQNTIYALAYSTTYTLKPEDVANLPQIILNERPTGIGVIPLIKIRSAIKNNPNLPASGTPILYSTPENQYVFTIIHLETEYEVSPQDGDGNYQQNSGKLKYQDVLIINGIYLPNGTYNIYLNSIRVSVRIKQDAYAGTIVNDPAAYSEYVINLPITVTKPTTTLTLKTPDNITSSTFLGNGSNKSEYKICREILEGSITLNLNDFATTDRLLLSSADFDTTKIVYYISKNGEIKTYQNNCVRISGNLITFLKVTDTTDPVFRINFYQEADAMYQRSNYIGIDDNTVNHTTIQLEILKSTPTFVGQIPSVNTVNPNTLYSFKNIIKSTTDSPFEIEHPTSDNFDSKIFIITSSDPYVVQIKIEGGKSIAYIYNEGVAQITILQEATTNFNKKFVTFNVIVNRITPSIVNCNTNIVYTNPYQKQFWTRFKPECPNFNLTYNGRVLSTDEVTAVYDQRRKTEILKYSSSVGGLTKSQKYAKAARGELMRQIGNENKYLRNAGNTLTCPTPSSSVLCGLTSACGVPGKERLLCYDPSINIYNLTRTYQYKAGLQTSSNIPTLALTQPRNLVGIASDTIAIIRLSWDSPVSNGGYPITGYVITYSRDNKSWAPYTSLFPNGTGGLDETSGEKNGNTAVFQEIPNSVPVEPNTLFYISVFSANERGLSSVPATITVKTISSPSIISDLSLYDEDRKNYIVDLKWNDPVNTGVFAGSGYKGPPIIQYDIKYRTSPTDSWTSRIIDLAYVIIPSESSQLRRYVLRNLNNEKTYYVKISPINSVGTGPESKILTAMTLKNPDPPKNVVVYSSYGKPIASLTSTLDAPTSNSLSYIKVTWDRPDNGGSPIFLYRLSLKTVTTSFIKDYTVSTFNQSSSYEYNITKMPSPAAAAAADIELLSGTYTISIISTNEYGNSISTSDKTVIVDPIYAKVTILSITGSYSLNKQLRSIIIKFTTGPFNSANTIKMIKVSGLQSTAAGDSIEIRKDILGMDIVGNGEYSIEVPAKDITGREYLIMNTPYNITLSASWKENPYVYDQLYTSAAYGFTPSIL